jgi:hypothetical protein
MKDNPHVEGYGTIHGELVLILTGSPFTEVCTVIYGRMVQKKLSSSQTTPLKNTTNGQFPPFHPEKCFLTILKVDGIPWVIFKIG